MLKRCFITDNIAKCYCGLFQAKQRRRELQKIRALVTYQEQKFHREKRIKSKKYVCYLTYNAVVDILNIVQRFHKMQRKAKKQSKPEGDIEKAERLRAKVHV